MNFGIINTGTHTPPRAAKITTNVAPKGADCSCVLASVPNNKPKLESFIQSLLLNRVEELVGIKSKYFITGHLHSYVHEEMNDFEYIRVPSSVTADEFAESLGFMTKARQNCFIVGQNHIEDTLHFYFD